MALSNLVATGDEVKKLLKRGIFIIAIIDAELLDGKLKRLPNLACMKIAGYYKAQGKDVILKTDTKNLQEFERVYISKVFTSTKTDEKILSLSNVKYGGTGFFYEKAPKLPFDMEHSFPDYSLYDGYVAEQFARGYSKTTLKGFTDYSLGFLTRGCFRKCAFCVNKTFDRCILHSPLNEFLDLSRKKIMLLDDNILANPHWRKRIVELIKTEKPFIFKQGIDIRLMNLDFVKLINMAKYDREVIFAFDNIADSKVIEAKLSLFREHSNKPVKMYVFCGFDRTGKYDKDFWISDIESIFKRLAIIGKYRAIPYIMRYEKYIESPHAGMYKAIASYCNKVGIFKKINFSEYCFFNNKNTKSGLCSEYRYYKAFIEENPTFEELYFEQIYWF